MAGPAFIRAGARAQSAAATTIAPAKPTVDGATGAQLAVVQSKNNAVHSCATAGWSKLGQVNSGASFTASLWIAPESAAAPTFTWSGSVACAAQVAYYSDPQNVLLATVSVLGTAGAGTAATHTSAAITTDAADTLAIYVDAAAANTAIATPAGWTEDVDGGSATDAGRTAFGSKPIAASGTSSGAISVTGAAAAWVQWQLELKGSQASGLQASKLGAVAWLEPPDGLDAAKIEAVAWLDKGQLFGSKLEVVAWLDAPAGLNVAKLEAVAWLDGIAAPVSGRRRMSLM
jgi:hypothetical protein